MVALGTFIFRSNPNGISYLWQTVGLVVPEGVLRLWDDAWDTGTGGWHYDMGLISEELGSWTHQEPGEGDVYLIPPDHPAHPAWWAWYCACQLGARHAPPVEEIGYDPNKLRNPNQS